MIRQLLLLACLYPFVVAVDGARPNIVLIYADDLGYGDLGCYGSTRIPTPNFDRVAQEGQRFTSGYAASATCTPSRYALLTGEYPWRRKGTGILPGDAALIIEPGRTTLPSLLKAAGYGTGVVGKWHLGLGSGGVDWNGQITPGPLEIGFDRSFIMAATGDRVPCVYVRDHAVVGLDPADPISVSYRTPFPGLPTGKANPELLRMRPSLGHDMAIINGIGRIGYMQGGAAAVWKDEDMADTFTGEAVRFIEEHHHQPFFLFFALHDPHVPRVPHPRFVGKTDLGPRGDAIVQADWCAGEVLRALDRLHLADNTLVIVSSDNGPVVDDGYQDQARERLGDHRPAGGLRGGKFNVYEGGTRVPLLVRWPARVKPGISHAIVGQVDLLASLAALTGGALSGADAPDSHNVLPALLGESPTGRDHIIQHARGLALRQGTWKFIPGEKPVAAKPDGGDKDPGETLRVKRQSADAAADQLYDLAEDPAERTNLAKRHPEVVERLRALLDQERTSGRTRP